MTLSDEIEISEALICLDGDVTIEEYEIVIRCVDDFGEEVNMTDLRQMLDLVQSEIRNSRVEERGLREKGERMKLDIIEAKAMRERIEQNIESGLYRSRSKI